MQVDRGGQNEKQQSQRYYLIQPTVKKSFLFRISQSA